MYVFFNYLAFCLALQLSQAIGTKSKTLAWLKTSVTGLEQRYAVGMS